MALKREDRFYILNSAEPRAPAKPKKFLLKPALGLEALNVWIQNLTTEYPSLVHLLLFIFIK